MNGLVTESSTAAECFKGMLEGYMEGKRTYRSYEQWYILHGKWTETDVRQ